VFGTLVGLDRDRAFYPTIAIVIASLYALFAAIGGSIPALVTDSIVGAGFVALAVVGFRSSQWLVVAALAGHGVLDLVHGALISNPGVPHWWPGFCSGYDVVAAGYLAWLITRRRTTAARPVSP
jgi:hypothetical protein